jgi:tetratricopeptide (TPR) repeat protein
MTRFIFLSLLLATSLTFLLQASKERNAIQGNSRNRNYVFCAPSFDPDMMDKAEAPIIEGLGNLHYKISTKSAKAQQYFNQGLTLLYAFNHGESGRSFREAIRYDSSCSMAYWGLAMVLGPNYNAALNPSSLADINNAIDNAIRYSTRATEKERSLINALATRFPKTEVKDMTPYNEAYANSMKQVHEGFPDDIDIAAIYADALMNEHPWNLWLKDGTPQPWTPSIKSLLEKTLEKSPDHPGAIHLYIHAMEASKSAGIAAPFADRLPDLLPSAGHLVHMPSHIYIRTGRYHDGVIVNEKSIQADSTYISQCKVQGVYPMLYYPHNIHFLAACAFLEGNSKKALAAAWSVSANSDKKYLAESGTVQHYYIIPYYTMVHLAKWDEILQLPKPGESLKYPVAIWHYARGMAFAAKSRLGEAQKELDQVKSLAADESQRSVLVWESNSTLDLMAIAAYVLEGEIASTLKDYDEAIDLFKKAISIEDKLNYTEPPDWFFSVRHSLGHTYLQAGKFAEAEKVYHEDLSNLPENGWALMGLFQSLKKQGRESEASEIEKRFNNAWAWADININSSRKY